ncbi:hypothetical protein ACP70R_007247 [Stipagrostis hirtigluma subsp. patula]
MERADGKADIKTSTVGDMLSANLQQLEIATCWLAPMDFAKLFPCWQGLTMELRNALSTSSEASLLSKLTIYFMQERAEGKANIKTSTVGDMLSANLQQLEIATCWLTPMDFAKLFPCWQGLTMELRNALSTSSEASLLSKHMTYSITVASQGSMILLSPPANPNSSCDMLKSSLKTSVPR